MRTGPRATRAPGPGHGDRKDSDIMSLEEFSANLRMLRKDCQTRERQCSETLPKVKLTNSIIRNDLNIRGMNRFEPVEHAARCGCSGSKSRPSLELEGTPRDAVRLESLGKFKAKPHC